MPLPNFFLIGAPKSGTTALYHALKQHPDIFMGQVKEPGYFAFNGIRPKPQPGPGGNYLHRTRVWRAKDYLLLYAESGGCRVRGDATTLYLRSPEAARGISEAVPTGKIVAILRQPAERAYSNYHFMVNNGIEHAKTFAIALAEEPGRVERGWFSGLYHKKNGLYHNQLSEYYRLFPQEQIKIYLYEDWNESPEKLLQDIFQFLEVDPTFQPVPRRSNVTLVPRSRRLHRLALSSEFTRRRKGIRTVEPIRRVFASVLSRLERKYNLVTPPPLAAEMRRALTEEYREDITRLQGLIGRDLSHWLR